MISEKHQNRMFSVCDVIKKWSPCPEGRQHACVLSIMGKWIVATGFNDVKAGTECFVGNRSKCARLNKTQMYQCCNAIHAESNALRNCPIPTTGLYAFVSKKPCHKCMLNLKNFGISEVYWREEGHTQGMKEFK